LIGRKEKLVRRIFGKIGLVLVLWLSLMGLAQTTQPVSSPKKPIHVVILIDKLDEFWIHFVRITQVAAEQLGMRVSVFHGHESHIDMLRKAEELVRTAVKPDVIMFKSFKGNGRQIMEIAARHQVKTFSVNAPMVLPPHKAPESPYLIGELLPDDEQAGYALAKTLRAEMKKRKIATVHLVAINGDRADSPAQLRERGLQRAVAEFKDVVLHQLVSDSWTAPHTAHQFEVLRKRYPMINAVWGGNDTIALRVAAQAKASGYRLGENLFVGGIDISPKGLDGIRRGELVTSVGGHILDGGRALVILHDYFQLGKLSKKSWVTPMEPVTLSEVERYEQILDPRFKVPIDFKRYLRAEHPERPYDFSFPQP
jgi:ABC-type sugar transport system substrate-binding protein